MDAIATLADHVVQTGYGDLPPEAVAAAKTFILDTLGVGVAGSAGPWTAELVEAQASWGRGDEARVWGRGVAMPAPAAALCNAYQVHNSEFDCIHEAAVLHPLTALLAAALGLAERDGGVSGWDLIAAVALGVDVACHIGIASRGSMRFFRPATCGGFAATAALGKLKGFDAGTLVSAFGIVYSQMCGTMQAHTEGSPVLAMQIGFNARNGVIACDLAARGLRGPENVLEGPFGYLRLFEGDYDLGSPLAVLGEVWRIAEVAHKPFPSGRATHGVVDAVLQLKGRRGFAVDEVESVSARVPPLTHRLVGRPVRDEMEVNYARLCAAYAAARALIKGSLGVEDFQNEALRDAETLALARRVTVLADDNPDENTLTPVRIEVALKGGGREKITLDVVYGNPANPMPRAAQLAKFRTNWAAATEPLGAERGETLIARIDALEELADVRDLVDLMVP